jgi:hypothetical protein
MLVAFTHSQKAALSYGLDAIAQQPRMAEHDGTSVPPWALVFAAVSAHVLPLALGKQ